MFSRIKMAAYTRIKLHFDGSVCPQVPQKKCWFLVDKDNCNVVADLEYLIRERFELDRGQVLSLCLDDYLLPAMEKIHVVRDNDMIWVHAEQTDDIVDDLQSLEHSTTRQRRKRKCSDMAEETSPCKLVHRESPDAEELDSDRMPNESTGASVLQMDKDTPPKKNHSKKKKKKKKKNKKSLDERPKTPSSKSRSSKKDNLKQMSDSNIPSHNKSPIVSSNTEKKNKSRKREHKIPSPDSAFIVRNTRSKSNSSGDGSEDLHKRLASSPVSSTKSSVTVSTITPSTSTEHVENETIKSPTGLPLTKERNQVREKKRSAAPVVLSSGHIRFESSESELSSDIDSDADNGKQTSKQAAQEQTDRVQLSTDEILEAEGTEQPLAQNESFVQLPVPTPSDNSNRGSQSFHSNGQIKKKNSSSPHQIACNSRGTGSDRWHWGKGNWDKNSQLNTTQSNKSFIVENPPKESEPAPKDFTSFPSLVGPPRPGDIMAYKILELSESYCPELSNYKEGKVVSVDTATGQIGIELSHITMVTRSSRLGKFDLQWEDEEGDDNNDMNAANNSVDLNVSVQLQDLVDPRLVPSVSV